MFYVDSGYLNLIDYVHIYVEKLEYDRSSTNCSTDRIQLIGWWFSFTNFQLTLCFFVVYFTIKSESLIVLALKAFVIYHIVYPYH